MLSKLLDRLNRVVPTLEGLQRECLEVTALVVPLWLLMQIPVATNALPPAMEVVVEGVRWVVTWCLVPLCAVIMGVSGVLAVSDRDARRMLPYAVLILLDVLMLRVVLAWVG